MFYFEVKYDLFCKAQPVVACHIGEALLHGRSCFGVGNGGWHAWEEQAGLSPYQGEMEQPGSLAAGEELEGLALEKGDGPLP